MATTKLEDELRGNVTLHSAAYEGRIGAVQEFLEEQPSRLNSQDEDGRTPLHWAAAGGKTEIVDYLLGNFKDVAIDTKDEGGWTPLMSATSVGAVKIVEMLLARDADANMENENGRIPLHFHKGRTDVIDLLAPVTKNINKQDELGSTPLHRAAAPGFRAACEALLAAGANPNVEDRYGETPLSAAVDEKRLDVAQLLVDNGAVMPNKEKK